MSKGRVESATTELDDIRTREDLARITYEAIFDERWDDASQAERACHQQAADAILDRYNVIHKLASAPKDAGEKEQP